MAFTASDICKVSFRRQFSPPLLLLDFPLHPSSTVANLFPQIIFAVLLPPLGVFLERGCNADFCINILLTILGYMCVPSPLSIIPPC